LTSFISSLLSRFKFFESFFGLSKRFKLWIFSEVFKIFTEPQWFEIYLKKDLGASDENIGLSGAVKGALSILSMPLRGVIGQRFNKKKIALLSIVLYSVIFVIAFLANDWVWALLIALILGFHEFTSPGVSALVGEMTDRSTRATVFALESTIFSIVIMLRGPFQGFIADTMGLRSLYPIAIVGFTISFIVLAKMFPDIKSNDTVRAKESEVKSSNRYVEQVRQIFSNPIYRRNFLGLV